MLPWSLNMAGSSSWSRDQYIEQFDFPFCEEVSKYEKQAKIGQGTFGEVFKARDRKNKNKVVALKKVLMENEKEGFPITALREIRILQLLRHENIVNLIEICRTKASHYNRYKSTFYLVFDFCEHDLAGLLSNVNVKFSLGEIKKVMQQLLNGLYFIHSQKILHRDMKVRLIFFYPFLLIQMLSEKECSIFWMWSDLDISLAFEIAFIYYVNNCLMCIIFFTIFKEIFSPAFLLPFLLVSISALLLLFLFVSVFSSFFWFSSILIWA